MVEGIFPFEMFKKEINSLVDALVIFKFVASSILAGLYILIVVFSRS